MNKQIPEYLKLVADTITEAPTVPSEDLTALHQVCLAFQQTTGWKLEYAADSAPLATQNLMWSAPVNPGVGNSPGHIRLLSLDESSGEVSTNLESAAALADAIGKLWGELLATRHALWQREAELASGVPLVVREDDRTPALADLEALLGHAVVLADDRMHDYWKVPEPGFASCVCVPVSSPTMPLGTLWAYCEQPREFSDPQTNILEVVAGRLAADLERQVLVGEALSARDQTKHLAALSRTQQEQLPRHAPMIAGWEIAAKAYHAGSVGGTFYDWFALADGGLNVLAGDALSHGIEGAMTVSALRSASRAFAAQRKDKELARLLETVNSVLWGGSAGDACAGMFHGTLEPNSDALHFTTAGPMRVVAVSSDGCTTLAGPTRALGLEERLRTKPLTRRLRAGELVLAYGTTFMSDSDEALLAAFDERLALALEPHLKLPARKLVEIAGEILQTYPSFDPRDRVLVVLKRTGH